MQGGNFIVTDSDRIPSVFAAYVMFFIAVLGRELTGLLTNGLYFLFSFLVPGLGTGFVNGLSSFIYYGLFILVPFALYASRHPGMSEYIRIKPLDGRSALLCAVAAPVGVLLAAQLTCFWMMLIEAVGGKITGNDILVPEAIGGKLSMVLTGALLPAVCEELLMRGCMLTSREEKGSARAIVLTALWFTALHASVEGIPAELMCGLILGFMAVVTDTIFAGMIYHFVHNSVVLIITFAQGPAAEEAAVSTFNAVGGFAGCFMMALECLILGAIMFYLFRALLRRHASENIGKPPVEGAEKSFSVYAVAACCVIFVLLEYALDILSVAGVVR